MTRPSFDAFATARAIAAVQHPDGAIPEFPGGTIDTWNHIEAAMALDVAGLHQASERAYLWLLDKQRPDGAWHAVYAGDNVIDTTLDANFVAYMACGLHHHLLATGDDSLLDRSWARLQRAVRFVLDLQLPSGAIAWARDAEGRAWLRPLVTSSSCIAMSLRSAIALADVVGDNQPDWELALVSLERALRDPATPFEEKSRFAMDWYYPVLSGALDADRSAEIIRAGWDTFVIDGHGCRCVTDRPWVTAGETAELILACDAAGLEDEAHALFDWLQQLRDPDGAYWIGATQPDGTVWPRQKPTWGSGSVVLAGDALLGDGATAAFFRTPVRAASDPVADAL